MLILLDNFITLIKVIAIVVPIVLVIYALWNGFAGQWWPWKKQAYVGPVLAVGILAPMVFLFETKAPGYDKLVEVCETQWEYELGEPVYVEGYYTEGLYNGRSWITPIVEQGARYMEVKIDSIKHNKEYPEPGIWRIEKQLAGSNQCSDRLFKSAPNSVNKSAFWSDYCVSLEKVDSPKSEYGYFYEVDETILNNRYQSVFSRITKKVENIKTGRIISTASYFDLLPYKKHGIHYGFTLRCSDIWKDENKKTMYQIPYVRKSLIIKSGV